MKRFKLFALSLLALGVIATSCSEDDAEEVNVTSSGTIQGIVEANFDLRNDTAGIAYEPVSGATIYARITSEDLTTNVDSNFGYPRIVYSTTTGTDGSYELTIPASAEGTNVEIYADDFREEVILDTNNNTTSVTFVLAPLNTLVIRDQTRIVDIQY